DFFLLVRQILTTYNPESAHVSLADWKGGVHCRSCSSWVSDDDYSCCDHCDERFCSDCSWTCERCSSSICSGCSRSCSQCDERFCESCLTTPEETTLLICDQCLKAQKKDDSNDTNDVALFQQPASPPPTIEGPASAADSICVGQTPLPARSGRNGSRRVRR